MSPDANSWAGWLEAQWQHYWTGLAIGKVDNSFKQGYTGEKDKGDFPNWVDTTNQTYGLKLKVDKKQVDR